ncbi:TetR/AcrR family transcriptional regulator [Nocardia sp. NPDC051030]|uniref:TetR/AcrR family transcriptional regulator n=1 Tax=Nocardia sp. NPDC051030 TaxID=3155162 RepID=UPI0034417D17
MPETRPIRRKKPTQDRARESRERVLASAAHLFAARGIPDTSTNRIAAHANMSIGTLYRYFNDKHEIVEILRTRFLAEVEETFTAAVLSAVPLPPREAVATGLHAIVETLSARESLVRALSADATLSGIGLQGLERRLLLLTQAFLLHHLTAVSTEDLETRAFVMVNAGLSTCLRIALDPPSGLDRDHLVQETANLIGGWIAS